MLESRLTATSDLPLWAVIAALTIGLASLVLLFVELARRRGGSAALIAGSGAIAVIALVLAVLRPVRIAARESVIGARVVVLGDASRSMALPGDDDKKRFEARDLAIAALAKAGPETRWTVLGFGEGAPAPLAKGEPGSRARSSDLGAALRALATSTDERPSAVVVVSDGRLDDAAELGGAARDLLGVPVHTVATTKTSRPDASVRRVGTPGAAIAHVPLPLRVEVGCTEGLACDGLTVTAR